MRLVTMASWHFWRILAASMDVLRVPAGGIGVGLEMEMPGLALVGGGLEPGRRPLFAM
jgi:hypothetical protein